jgi:hypothetical protein
VARKTALLLVPALFAALIGSQWQDIMRLVKIRRMSMGSGHPEYVPVEGSKAYPQHAAGG